MVEYLMGFTLRLSQHAMLLVYSKGNCVQSFPANSLRR
jgi:hypothetical protein